MSEASGHPEHPESDRIFDAVQMMVDAGAIGQALLDGDLVEARFRIHMVTTQAAKDRLTDVEEASSDLSRAIQAATQGHPSGVGSAFDTLLRVLERRLRAD